MELSTPLQIKETNDFKYYVIKFLELPHEDINEIVCIPWMWIVLHRKRDLNVVVSYPVESPSETEKRVKDREKHSKDWNLYKSTVIFATDSYEDAKRITSKWMNLLCHTHDQCSNLRIAGQSSSAKVEETTRRSKQTANSKPKKRLSEFAVSSINHRSALKRPKVVKPAEGLISTSINESPLAVEKSSPAVEKSSPAVEKSSNSSVQPRIIASRDFFTKLFTLLRDLHTIPARDASMIDLLRETLIQNAETIRKLGRSNVDVCASLASSTVTPKVSTSKGRKSRN